MRALLIALLMLAGCATRANISERESEIRHHIVDWRNSGVIGRLDYWLDVRSEFLELPRHVEIWLPPQYDTQPTRRFPVVYMHDGQNLFDPRIANTGVDWGVDEAINDLASRDLIEPAIVVGVWCTQQRRFEYAPAGVLASIPATMKLKAADEFPPELRLGDAYLRFLVEELKPRIDAAYRTRPDRDSTFMIGSSMGALISIYGMAERPDVFGGAAGLSMHWPLGVSEAHFVEQEDEWRPAVAEAFAHYFEARRLDPATHRIWVDHGTGFLDHHYVRYQASMLPVLQRFGFTEGGSLAARIYPGADHNETAWRARVREPLLFLLGPHHVPATRPADGAAQ